MSTHWSGRLYGVAGAALLSASSVVVAFETLAFVLLALPAWWLGVPLLGVGGWLAWRVCRLAAILAGPPRLLRPTTFGGVALGNPPVNRSVRQSLACASLACVAQLALMWIYGWARDVGADAALASGEVLVVVALTLGSLGGWAHGMLDAVRWNIYPSAAPPLLTYTLLLRPYPTNGWVTSVAARAATAQLVTMSDPRGHDAWDVSNYLSVVCGPRFQARHFWTEGDHWFLAVSDAVIHAQQVIAEVSNWELRADVVRGVHQELVRTMSRDRDTGVAYLIERNAVPPPWLPSALVVSYDRLLLWISPWHRRAVADALRAALQRSNERLQYTQYNRMRRAFEIGQYLDSLHADDVTDPARAAQLEQLLGDFASQSDVRRNQLDREAEDRVLLEAAGAWLARGDRDQAKGCLMKIAPHIPETYQQRTDSRRAVQVRASGMAEFLEQAIQEGQGTGKPVEWVAHVYPQACYLLGRIAFEDQDWVAAISWLRRGLHLSPADVELLAELGAVYNRCGMPDAALECYGQILSLGVEGPDRARALRGRGFALVELGRLDEARQAYLTSLQIDPDSTVARSELAEIEEMRQRGGKGTSEPG